MGRIVCPLDHVREDFDHYLAMIDDGHWRVEMCHDGRVVAVLINGDELFEIEEMLYRVGDPEVLEMLCQVESAVERGDAVAAVDVVRRSARTR